MLLNAAGSKDSVERLRQAATQLHVAADELSSGTSKAAIGAKSLGSSAARLSDGVAQLGAPADWLSTVMKLPQLAHRLGSTARPLPRGGGAQWERPVLGAQPAPGARLGGTAERVS